LVIVAMSARSPDTGTAPRRRTTSADAGERARARTWQPRATKSAIKRRPTKPEPPVTNAADPGAGGSAVLSCPSIATMPLPSVRYRPILAP